MHYRKSLIFLAALTAAGIVSAGTISTPHVAGSMDGWAGADSYTMTETSLGSDIWTLDLTGLTPEARYEFKVTDGTWDNSYPGPNSWLFADGSGNVTITYDGNSYSDGWSSTSNRIGLSVDPGTWTAVGDFQSEVGGADWDNANPNTVMTPLGGGMYSFTVNDLAAGDYKWKAVVSGSWDSISWDNRSVGTADWLFSTDLVNNDVTFYVDALAGTAKIEVIPEPATIGLISLFGIALLGARRFFKN